jgi:hypothetical protein
MSLTDTLGSLAVASKGHFMTGVSTDIGTSFIKPAGRVGDTLYGKAVVTAMGKSLAYTRVDFTNDKGTLVAYGCTSSFCDESESQIRHSARRPHQIHRQVIKPQGPPGSPVPSFFLLFSTSSLQDNVEFTEDGGDLVEKRSV